MAAILLLILAVSVATPGSAEPDQLQAGQPAPLFRLPDLHDREFSLVNLAGEQRVVVLLFWGVWCPFCREIMVRLRDLHVELHPEGLEIVTISMRESRNKIRMFIDMLRPAYLVLVDEWAETQEPYAIRDVPRIVVLDGDLTVLATRITTSMPVMENLIREVMGKEPEAPTERMQTTSTLKEETP